MELVFFTKIVLTYSEKNYSSDREKLLKLEAAGQEFAKFLRSIGQFIQAVKGKEFSDVSKIGRITIQIGKKILGFRMCRES